MCERHVFETTEIPVTGMHSQTFHIFLEEKCEILFPIEIDVEMATSLLFFGRADLNLFFATVIALERDGGGRKHEVY